MNYKNLLLLALILLLTLTAGRVSGHSVDQQTKAFLVGNEGSAFVPFLYIGAKHMVTGYDHLLFLVGVIFFLYRPHDILIYVSFFTLGHSLTLLVGVLGHISVNAYLIDAIIAFSIVYKGFDNLGGFKKVFGFQPNTKATVLMFGLFHGFGLANTLQDFEPGQKGIVTNLIGFNLGVEIGQVIALTIVLLIMSTWRHFESFKRFSILTNTLLMAAGFGLIAYQLTGYFSQ